MLTIEENREKVNSMATKAWDKFYEQCSEHDNLNDKSIAALMGVSRQTVKNWCTGKSQPCVGTVMRIKMVITALDTARDKGMLPAQSKNKQDALVQEILK